MLVCVILCRIYMHTEYTATIATTAKYLLVVFDVLQIFSHSSQGRTVGRCSIGLWNFSPVRQEGTCVYGMSPTNQLHTQGALNPGSHILFRGLPLVRLGALRRGQFASHDAVAKAWEIPKKWRCSSIPIQFQQPREANTEPSQQLS